MAVDPIIEDARQCLISADMAERLIDRAIQAGHRVEDLRWLMSRTQRRQLRKYLRMVAPLDTLRPEIEEGRGRESGLFCGVPYIVSDCRGDVVVLQVVEEKARVGMIDGLAVDYQRPVENT